MPPLDPVELLTPRLRLRPLADADAQALLRIHAEPRVMRFSNSPCWTGLEQAQGLIEASRRWLAAGSALCLAIEPADGTEVIGTCTLYDLDRGSRRAELGFVLGLQAWGRGCMAEALGAFLRHAFGDLDLNRVEADTDPRNASAVKTLERQGFVREGLLRERWITEGQVSDAAMYGLLRRDWLCAREAQVHDGGSR